MDFEFAVEQPELILEQPELILWCKHIFMSNSTELLGKVMLRLGLSWGCDNSPKEESSDKLTCQKLSGKYMKAFFGRQNSITIRDIYLYQVL